MMATCPDCKHGEFKRGPQGNVGSRTMGKCTYSGPLLPACNRGGKVFAILAWTGKDCPTFESRCLTVEECAAIKASLGY